MVPARRCKDLYFLLWSGWGIRAYVPADDFLSWPHVCDRKGETPLSEVTQWLLGPTGGQMTLKCFVYLSTATNKLWTGWPEILYKNLATDKKLRLKCVCWAWLQLKMIFSRLDVPSSLCFKRCRKKDDFYRSFLLPYLTQLLHSAASPCILYELCLSAFFLLQLNFPFDLKNRVMTGFIYVSFRSLTTDDIAVLFFCFVLF